MVDKPLNKEAEQKLWPYKEVIFFYQTQYRISLQASVHQNYL